jgi:hypothetical protein
MTTVSMTYIAGSRIAGLGGRNSLLKGLGVVLLPVTIWLCSTVLTFAAPEIAILGTNMAVISDGDNTPSSVDGTHFGSTNIASGFKDHVYTITNSGTTALTISGVTTSGVAASNFIIISGPASSVPSRATTTFTVRFRPSATGNRNGTINVLNNDTTESTYNFAVRGVGIDCEIDVQGTNGTSITDGDTTPSAAQGTDFYSVRVTGGTRDHVLTIENTGTASLNISAVTNDGPHASDFILINPPNPVVIPGATTTFTLRFDPQATGTRTATVHVANDDQSEADYTFRVQGIGIEPEIAVLGTNRAVIVDGESTVSVNTGTQFGQARVYGGSVSRTFFVTNQGSMNLSVSGVTTGGPHAADFIVTAMPAANVTNGGATSFTVQFNPQALGARTAVVHVASDDADEADYTFAVEGTGVEPEIAVLGTNGVVIADGTGTPTVNEGTDYGNVRVSGATVDRVFTVTNSGTTTLSISGVTTNGTNPADFLVTSGPASSVAAGAKTTFTLRFNPAALGVRSAVVHVMNDDADEADYNFTVQGTGVEPEIAVLGTNDAVIADGDVTPSVADGTDYGAVRTNGVTVDHVFTVTNSGTTVLNITGVTTNGTNPGDFRVISGPAAAVAAGAKTTFTLRFDPSLLGVRSAVVHVMSDDANEADYNFTVQGTGVEPEIAVLGTNGVVIADGDVTPNVADGTEYGSVRITGVTVDHVFTVTNSGTTVLNISGVTTNGANPGEFLITSGPVSTVAAGAKTTFTVRFDPAALGVRSAVVHVMSDDADEADYNFTVQGTGVEPEIAVLGTNGTVIANGDVSPSVADGTDYGSVRTNGVTMDHVFTVTNSGTMVLNISGVTTNGTNPDEFLITSGPASSVAAGAKTTFTVRFDPAALGIRSAVIHVMSDDADEADYSFTIQGTGVEPEIALLGTNDAVIANGDVSPSIADGTDYGPVRTNGVTVDHIFTVTNSGTAVLNISGVTTNGTNPGDFLVVSGPSAAVAAGAKTSFTVRFDPSLLGSRSATIHVLSDDADAADYSFAVQGAGVEPEIAVLGTNGAVIADGDVTPSVADGTDYGAVRTNGVTVDHVFTVTNSGTTVLNISGVTTNGTNPGDFRVVASPSTTVAAGGASTFTVRFDPSLLGTRSAVIHVMSDDADEADYSFTVQGTGVEPEIAVLGTNGVVIANGDVSPSTADGTDYGFVRVFGVTVDHVFTVTNSGTTVLNISGVTTNGANPGEFIMISGPASTVAAGTKTTFTVRYDPSSLGAHTAMIHVLNDDADEADYSFTLQGTGVEPEIAVLGTNDAVIANGSVTPSVADGSDFGLARVSGATVDHVFTVTNSGTTVLNISGVTTNGTNPSDFIVISSPSATVSAGAKTTFTMRFNPAALGVRSAVVHVMSDDANEADYNFAVQGTGVEPDIAVLGTNGAVIADGDMTPNIADGTDYGAVRTNGVTIDHVFTITNFGSMALTISGVTTNGANPGDFRVTSGPSSTVAAGATAAFTVRFDPSLLGSRSAVIHVLSDDVDEADYDFAVQGTGVEPEIAVLGTNGALIASGDVTPVVADGTDYGEVRTNGVTVDHVFTVTNSGSAVLNVSGVTTNGANPGDFHVVTSPSATVAAGAKTTFTVRFDPSLLGSRSAVIHVLSDDADEADYTFTVQGTGVEPEIAVLGTNGALIASGDVTPIVADGTDYGEVRTNGVTVDHVFTVTNSGTTVLNISGVTTNGPNPGDFRIVSGPSGSVAAGAKTTFTVRFDPSLLGVRSAVVHVLSDDADETDYTFTVQGMGVEPEIAVLGTNGALIADGDVTPSVVDGTDYGQVRVSGATMDHVFMVTNSGTTVLNISSITTNGANPGDFLITSGPSATVPAGAKTTFTVRFDPFLLGARSAVIHVLSDDADEADYNFAVQGTGVEPEIAVLGTNGALIADGDLTPSVADGTDYGAIRTNGVTVDHIFTITNSGLMALTISGVTTNGANPSEFLVTAGPAATVAAGAKTTFTVRCDPSALGVRSAILHVLSDDVDEADYDFAVQCTGVEPEIAVLGTNGTIIADGDVTPSMADGTDYGSVRTNGVTVDHVFTVTNSGTTVLNITGVTTNGTNPGDFRIVSGPSGSVAAGAKTTFTVRFDPSLLGVRSAVVHVLSDDADESDYDFAVQGTGVEPEIAVLGTNGALIVDGDVTPSLADGTDFGTARVFGVTSDRVFTVTNSGTTVLNITGVTTNGTNPGDFRVVSGPSGSVVAGAATTFTVRFDPSVVGSRSAVLHVMNDDADEADYNFTVQGTGIEPEIAVLGTNGAVIADGDVTPSVADGTDYGAVRVFATNLDHTFTVTNSGNMPLSLTGVTTNGSNPGDFVVVSSPSTPVAAGAKTAFTVRFDPSALGARSAVIHVWSDDADEADYSFTIQGTGVEPEIAVLGTNGAVIANGDVTPNVNDGTDFGNIRVYDGSTTWPPTRTHTLTITNSGTTGLNLSGITTNGANPADFIVISGPGAMVAAGAKATFTLRFNPSALGSRTATIHVLNDDADEPDYSFTVQGTGVEPEIAVLGTNGVVIADDSVIPTFDEGTDFGWVHEITGRVDHVFAITNLGSATLYITGVTTNGTNPADFIVINGPATSLVAGAKTTFTLRFNPQAQSNRSAVIHVMNDDEDEPDYSFAVQGTGLGPEIHVLGTNGNDLADGDVTPSLDDGTDFGELRVYNDSTTWPSMADHVFTVTNSGSADLIISGVTTTGAEQADFIVVSGPVSSVAAGDTATFTLRFNPSALGLRSATVHIHSDDADESDYSFAVQGTGVEPEIEILGTNEALIANGSLTPTFDDGTDFGSLRVWNGAIDPSTRDHVFTITNAGTVVLTVFDVTTNGANADDFIVLSGPETNVAIGATTTFTVRFDPSAVGLRSAEIHVSNDDEDESDYRFVVQGTGVEPEMHVLGTNLDEIVSGNMTPDTDKGTDFGDVRVFDDVQTSSPVKDHVFTITNAGTANLIISGVSTSGSEEADFTILSGPDSFLAVGQSTTFTVRFNPSALGLRQAVFTLDNDDYYHSTNYVFAVQGTGVEPEMEILGTNLEVIADGETIPSLEKGTDFGKPEPFTSGAVKLFTITNAGSSLLTLTGMPLVVIGGVHSNDFTVVSQPDSTVDVGRVTTFQIRFDPIAMWGRTAEVFVASDDADEPNYHFTIRGEGPTSAFFSVNAPLTGVRGNCLAWGDYDNDGDLDLIIAGYNGTEGRTTKLYRNDGQHTFNDSGVSFLAVESGAVAWGDYDNDGDLDLALAGYNGSACESRIYRNDGMDTFTDIDAGLPGIYTASLAWGDYNNDGQLDLAMAGLSTNGRLTRVYKNLNGVFTDTLMAFDAISDASLAWGDYDKDGYIDLLMSGSITTGKITKLYRNDGHNALTNSRANFIGVSHGRVAWCDYDNDGDLDVTYTGYSTSTGAITRLYQNVLTGFVSVVTTIPGVWQGDMEWGDFNNDGYADLAIAGTSPTGAMAKFYRNLGGGRFADYPTKVLPMLNCGLAWGDYDNDGVLDLAVVGNAETSSIAKIYRDYYPMLNTPPLPPSNLTWGVTNGGVVLRWATAKDAETTNSNGLSYNLYIGTAEGSGDRCSAMADTATGWRRVVALGNAQKTLFNTMKGLPEGTYYWGVQAIDAAGAGSLFATGTFTRPALPEFSISSLSNWAVPFTAFVVVSNSGTAAGDAGLLSVWLNQPTNMICGAASDRTNAVGVLNPGETKMIEFSGWTMGTDAVSTIFRAYVDSHCTTIEESDDNNQEVMEVSIPARESFWFSAVALTNNVILRWSDPAVCGVATPTVHIRFHADHYPASLSDGSPLYTGNAQVCEHTGLTAYQPYYYTIWVSPDGLNFVDPPE